MGPPSTGYAGGSPAVMPVQLTLDEQYLLQRGYISSGEHVAGGAVALFFGLGIGHAVQGRWNETGWIFTLGEAGSGVLFVGGLIDLAVSCTDGCSDARERRGVAMVIGGALGMVVFRIWEIVDAFAGPPRHNARLRELHMRLGMPVPMYTRLSPYLAPSRDGDGAVAGLSLGF